MFNGGALHKFPGGKGDASKSSFSLPREPSPLPTLDAYTFEETVGLYEVTLSVKKKAEDLILPKNRSVARQAGIEMLAVQIVAILEGDKFQRVVEALEDAVYRRVPISLTREGTDKVHRLERLVADADTGLKHFMSGRGVAPMLGQPAAYGGQASNDMSLWMPVAVIGVVGILVIAIIAITQKSRTP